MGPVLWQLLGDHPLRWVTSEVLGLPRIPAEHRPLHRGLLEAGCRNDAGDENSAPRYGNGGTSRHRGGGHLPATPGLSHRDVAPEQPRPRRRASAAGAGRRPSVETPRRRPVAVRGDAPHPRRVLPGRWGRTRWAVIDGDEAFLRSPKRLHNRLHGAAGDTGNWAGPKPITMPQSSPGTRFALVNRVDPGDVVVLHDPQTVGLGEALTKRGTRVVWRCHIGTDRRNAHTEEGWDFLQESLRSCSAYIFLAPGLRPSISRGRRHHDHRALHRSAHREESAYERRSGTQAFGEDRPLRRRQPLSGVVRGSSRRSGPQSPGDGWLCRCHAGITSRTCRVFLKRSLGSRRAKEICALPSWARR